MSIETEKTLVPEQPLLVVEPVLPVADLLSPSPAPEGLSLPSARKRPLFTVDFETETDPIAAAADATLAATVMAAPASPERGIIPLPKRRKIEFGFKHLALSGALGFVAGTVATVAGLASLESMFPQ